MIDDIEFKNGKCVKCGEYAELGNGLCKKCWDKQTNKMKPTQIIGG